MQSWVKANHLSKFIACQRRNARGEDFSTYIIIIFFFDFNFREIALLLMVNAIVREEEEEAMESSHVAFIYVQFSNDSHFFPVYDVIDSHLFWGCTLHIGKN